MTQSEQKAAPADLDQPAPGTALTVQQRAAVVLKSTETENSLRELAKASVDIVAVIDPAGREQSHRIGMNLKNARLAVQKTGAAATEDARAFHKAVVAESARLVAIITPEEDRIFGLRDGYDAKVAAEKAEAERIAAETRAALRLLVNNIVALPARAAGQSSAVIFEMLRMLSARDVESEGFGDMTAEALAAVNTAGTALNELYEQTLAREQAQAKQEAEAAIERARQEEKAEANRKETARLAALQREHNLAEAERQRVAAETKRQLEAQAAAIEAKRKADEAAAQAERDAFAAKVAAFEAAQQKELDHAEALAMDATITAERVEAARIAAEQAEAAAQQALAKSAATAPESAPVDDPEPTEQVGAASLDSQEQQFVSNLRTAIWDLMGVADIDLVRREMEIAIADFSLMAA